MEWTEEMKKAKSEKMKLYWAEKRKKYSKKKRVVRKKRKKVVKEINAWVIVGKLLDMQIDKRLKSFFREVSGHGEKTN